MRKTLLTMLGSLVLALAISPAFVPHAAVAQEPPLPVTWPQTYTFTGATPAPWVLSVQGYKYCTVSAPSTATFNSTTLTAEDANDGATYEVIHGTSDLGATPAPADTLAASGKLTFNVTSHLQFELVASGGGSSTSIPVSASCST